jgi:hypothetical protein
MVLKELTDQERTEDSETLEASSLTASHLVSFSKRGSEASSFFMGYANRSMWQEGVEIWTAREQFQVLED